MSLSRSLFHEFRPLFRILEEPARAGPAVFYNAARFSRGPFQAWDRPAIDLSEKGDTFIIEAELPGMKKENLEVHVGDRGRSVTIEGKVKGSEESTKGGYGRGVLQQRLISPAETEKIFSERSSLTASNFIRRIWLPQTVDGAAMKAKLEDGLLTIQVPKSKEESRVRVNVD